MATKLRVSEGEGFFGGFGGRQVAWADDFDFRLGGDVAHEVAVRLRVDVSRRRGVEVLQGAALGFDEALQELAGAFWGGDADEWH